jgi:hypothetical protein
MRRSGRLLTPMAESGKNKPSNTLTISSVFFCLAPPSGTDLSTRPGMNLYQPSSRTNGRFGRQVVPLPPHCAHPRTEMPAVRRDCPALPGEIAAVRRDGAVLRSAVAAARRGRAVLPGEIAVVRRDGAVSPGEIAAVRRGCAAPLDEIAAVRWDWPSLCDEIAAVSGDWPAPLCLDRPCEPVLPCRACAHARSSISSAISALARIRAPPSLPRSARENHRGEAPRASSAE